MDKQKSQSLKRYATAAIVLGGGGIAGAALLSSQPGSNTNYGRPITHNGRQYFVQQDGRRTVYPDKDSCLRDVPASRQNECEQVNSYRSGVGGWYGPVHSRNDNDGYNPDPRYKSEVADSTNTGKQLPKAASPHGFGENGKALTKSGGGS